ncbi:hypothetical protein EMCRGX_G008491 [Ephydatia muelleri]
MSKGYVETSVTKCLIIGAAGVGKTHLKHLLLKKDPPQQQVLEEDDWFGVEDDQALLKVVSGTIGVGHVSMNPDVTIFVLNLSEELSHQPTIKYNETDGKPVSRPYRSYLSHEQILQHYLGAMCSQDARPLIITVGTHRDTADKCTESIEEKNQTLKSLLDARSFHILYNREELKEAIFPVNGKTPQDKDRHVAKVLRQKIASVCPKTIQMPVAWLGLEVLLQTSSHDGILSLVECQGCARRLHIEGDAFSAALHHLVHHVFLHYPEVLPQTVFCGPQVILTKVTELVEYHHKLRDSPDEGVAAESDLAKFRDHGLLSVELLRKFPKHYKEGLFTPHDLLQLLLCVGAIAVIRDGVYLMPALLHHLDSKQVSKYFEQRTSLVIRPTLGCIPSGLFCCLVAYLLIPTNPSSWKVCMDGDKPFCLYRNCITFEFDNTTELVTLVDMFSHIVIYVDNMSSRVCREVRNCVHSGIKRACGILKYQGVLFEDAFMCAGASCTSDPSHVAIVTTVGPLYRWKCTVRGDQIGDLNNNQLMWYNEDTVTKPDPLSSAGGQSPLTHSCSLSSDEYISADEGPESHMTAMDVATRNRNKKAMDLLIDAMKKQKEMCTTNEVTKIANLNQQDPFVALLSTFPNTSMLRTSLNRGIASKALASSPHPFPIKVLDESGSISLEQKKKAKQRVRDLQTREQDLRRLKSKVIEKDIMVEKQAQCQKEKNLKRKMELFSIEAKQTSQRLSADNYQLREELRQEVHHHGLIRKSTEGEARQLELKISGASVRMRAVQRAVEDMGKMDQKSLKTIPFTLDLHLPHLKQIVEFKSFVHVIISGLPSLGKSHILNHLFFNEDVKTQVMNEEGLSVKETILTSDGHRWKWMQVSKTEASALAVGAGISQAYAKEGHSPDFVIPEDSSMDTIPRLVKEKARQFNNFTDIKRLSLINLWDIGANKVLFDLLPLLLPRSKRLVVLSVMSLDSDVGDMHSHMHEGKHGQEVLREPYSKLDYLMAPPSIARCSTVVVGTHTGKLPRDRLRARQQTVERLIRANAEEMGIGKTLYPKCIAVDTSNQGDNIVKIRSALEKVAVNNREHSVEVPLIWVCLHGNLVRECQSWYITKETLCHFAKQLGIINQLDVEKWLNLYSECGSMIYFDETTQLRNYIILKPGVFFSKVQKLYAGAKEAGHGRVHELAKQLWQKGDSEFLLNIFEHLGLMVRVNIISAALSSLFVVLPRASLSSTHLAKFVQFTKVLPSLEDIKYVVNEVDQYWNQLHLKLYSGPQLADVNIRIEDNHLEVKVTCALQGTDGDQMLHKACSAFKTAIVDFFQHISKDSSDLQYELSLLCPPSLQSPKPHFISFHPLDKEDASNRGMLFCGHCKCDVVIGDCALKWLRADYEGPKLSALKPEEVISIDLMVKLSQELSTIIAPQQMEVLGCALGCTNTDIEMMLRCSSMQECILSLLQRWVRNYHLPTKERLAQALKRSGCLDKTNRLISSNNQASSVLSLDELQVISQQVPHDCTCLKKELQIDDPETNCYKVLENWSKRKESSRDGLISALFSCGYTSAAEFLFLKNDAFRMFK